MSIYWYKGRDVIIAQILQLTKGNKSTLKYGTQMNNKTNYPLRSNVTALIFDLPVIMVYLDGM